MIYIFARWSPSFCPYLAFLVIFGKNGQKGAIHISYFLIPMLWTTYFLETARRDHAENDEICHFWFTWRSNDQGMEFFKKLVFVEKIGSGKINPPPPPLYPGTVKPRTVSKRGGTVKPFSDFILFFYRRFQFPIPFRSFRPFSALSWCCFRARQSYKAGHCIFERFFPFQCSSA